MKRAPKVFGMFLVGLLSGLYLITFVIYFWRQVAHSRPTYTVWRAYTTSDASALLTVGAVPVIFVIAWLIGQYQEWRDRKFEKELSKSIEHK